MPLATFKSLAISAESVIIEDLFFLRGEGLHVYQSLPIASVSAILTDRRKITVGQSKPQGIIGSTAHPMTREAASPWHELV